MIAAEGRRVGVLGAGMTGLVAAYRLSRAGFQCDVYERWPGLGGQVATLDVGAGVRLERYYHHLFTSDRHIAELYGELGEPDAIEWRPSRMAMLSGGRVYPFTTPLDLLRFRPLSLRSRLRLGLATLRLSRVDGGVAPFEAQTARTWVEREMGPEVWEKVWGPLLGGKFGDRADEISMAWLASKLKLRRKVGGAEARREVLGYPRGGWQPLLERLRSEIEAAGGQVLIDRPAARIRGGPGSFRIQPAAADSFRRGHDPRDFEPTGTPATYEGVIATVPNDVFLALLDRELAHAIGDEYLGRVRSISYQTALCLLLELDRPFHDHYWTNVADRELPFVGLIEQTNFVEPERYGGRRFLYVANYVSADDGLLALDAEELLSRYEPGLRVVNPDFDPAWVRAAWRFAEPAAQPVVTVGYGERIPALDTGVSGLVLANTTQIYPEDRGTNYSVRLGGHAAEAMLAALAAPVPATA